LAYYNSRIVPYRIAGSIKTNHSKLFTFIKGDSMKMIESKKHSLLLALCLVLSIALSNCATKNKLPMDHFAEEKLTSDEYAKLGDLCLSRGDSINAFVNYEKCLRMDPDNTRVHYMKGLLFLTEEQYPDAEESFLKVLKEEPDHARAHQGLGQVALQMKHYDKAEEYFKKAIELDPALWNSHNLLGVNYDYKRNHAAAINEYQAALGIKPNNGSILNNLGLSYSMAGKYEEAIRVLRKALETNFDQSKIYNNLGLVYFRAGRYEDAFKALQKGGDDAQALNNLGSMYLAQGNNEKARECFEKALVLRPHNYETANENLHKCNVTPFDQQFFASQKREIVSYKVKKGDNLYSIARKQNMEYSDLIRLNNLKPGSVIHPNQVLLVREQ
jgi:Tfp pilus assembly protein PilF